MWGGVWWMLLMWERESGIIRGYRSGACPARCLGIVTNNNNVNED